MRAQIVVFVCLGLPLAAPARSPGLESFSECYDNERVLKTRPGLDGVINDKARVYYLQMSRSNDRFMFRGDTEQLNKALRHFAGIEGDVREVVFRPGPGIGYSRDGETRIPHNWSLEIPGTSAKVLRERDQGHLVFRSAPVMTIYVSGKIKLEEIELPEGIVFTELNDLSRRYRKAIAAGTQNSVLYSGVERLATLSPHDEENLAVVARMLDHEEYWMRRTAARAIGVFGAKAKPHLAALRRCLESDQPALRNYARESIAAIEKAKENAKARQDFLAAEKAIERFCKMRPKRKIDRDP